MEEPHIGVLVVEDEGTARRALALILNLNGYETAAAASAEEALKILKSHPYPGIAIVDLDLPGMSGLDLIDRLKQLDSKIYVILVTAAEESRVREALHGGSIPYMQKPINIGRLLEMLHERDASAASP